jgi:hypothetical protein
MEESKKMFRKRKELQGLVEARTKALKKAESEVKELRNSNKELRTEKEEEYLENYNLHRQLLEIEKTLKEQDYGSVDNLKNKIRTILKKELVNNLQSAN